MSPIDAVLADIAMLERARDQLPAHSHIAALIELSLCRLQEATEVLRRMELRRAA